MEKIVKNISIILLIILSILLPFFLIGFAFGLAGATSGYFLLIALGYLGIIISSIVCIFRYKFFPLIIISIIVIFTGITLNDSFWKENNDQLCEDLRNNPTCIEDECGFNCPDFPLGSGGGFVTGGGICKDKDLSLCQIKRKKDAKNESDTQNVLKVYSNIVDKIITSPSPANENFENKLVAIYNCLEEKFGPGATGELKANQILKQKNLTAQQLEKYYLYHSSKGRNFTPGHITAGLPGGDKNLSCEYINVK